MNSVDTVLTVDTVDRLLVRGPMAQWTKLFSTIVTSTIWREDDKTRIVWVTCLALVNRYGLVEASVPGLAAMANVTPEECRASLRILTSPDPESRTRAHDGVRLKEVEGGWLVVNHAKYREAGRAVDRREYLRLKQRESRARRKAQGLVAAEVLQAQLARAELAEDASILAQQPLEDTAE